MTERMPDTPGGWGWCIYLGKSDSSGNYAPRVELSHEHYSSSSSSDLPRESGYTYSTRVSSTDPDVIVAAAKRLLSRREGANRRYQEQKAQAEALAEQLGCRVES